MGFSKVSILRYVLTLGNSTIGYVKFLESAATMPAAASIAGSFRQRTLEPKLAATELSMQIGFSVTKPLYDWIKSSLKNGMDSRNGSIIAADFEGNITNEREFHDAIISELSFPSLDAGSKDSAYMTLKLKTSSVTYKAGDGKKLSGVAMAQKAFAAAHFVLEIDGIPCKTVSKIDPFSFVSKYGAFQASNLKVTLSQKEGEAWRGWYEDTVIKGKSGEKNGSLKLLTEDFKNTLFTIDFSGVGLVELSHPKLEANKDTLTPLVAEMYVEEAKLSF
jgi:hypothetical protein